MQDAHCFARAAKFASRTRNNTGAQVLAGFRLQIWAIRRGRQASLLAMQTAAERGRRSRAPDKPPSETLFNILWMDPTVLQQ